MNFTAELEILAEIMGGLESTGITGLLWYLGYAMLKYVISTVVMLVVIYVCYKVAMRFLASQRDTKRLVDVGSLFGFDWGPYLTDREYARLTEEISTHFEHLGKYKEKAENRAERLGNLSVEYEQLYDKLLASEEENKRLKAEIRQWDPSINSDYDKEEASGIRTEGHDDSPRPQGD